MLILNDVHLREDADHVNATFRTGPRATHVVAGGMGPVV